MKLQQVKKRISFPAPKPKKEIWKIWKYAAAACIIFCAGLSVWLLVLSPKQDPPLADHPPAISPGHAQAVLVTANGKVIDLDPLQDTSLSATVHIGTGELLYDQEAAVTEQHELRIPRQGFYKLVLPDGSKVWLNSESSIQYPTRFEGTERVVRVTGETYFEVAHNAEHPFIVQCGNAAVTALGTAFNVNGYPNERGLTATLAEGKISVAIPGQKLVLHPGQQTLINHAGIESPTTVDTRLITSWTRNDFQFKNYTIREVMRMAERWYDVTVDYAGEVTDHFTGTISRDESIDKFLDLLTKTGRVHFTIAGKTITVRP